MKEINERNPRGILSTAGTVAEAAVATTSIVL